MACSMHQPRECQEQTTAYAVNTSTSHPFSSCIRLIESWNILSWKGPTRITKANSLCESRVQMLLEIGQLRAAGRHEAAGHQEEDGGCHEDSPQPPLGQKAVCCVTGMAMGSGTVP